MGPMPDHASKGMLVLVEFDLQHADLSTFESYESSMLSLLVQHGATLAARVRSKDGMREIHLLDFPAAAAFEAFSSDPLREELQPQWVASGAKSSITEVIRVE